MVFFWHSAGGDCSKDDLNDIQRIFFDLQSKVIERIRNLVAIKLQTVKIYDFFPSNDARFRAFHGIAQKIATNKTLSNRVLNNLEYNGTWLENLHLQYVYSFSSYIQRSLNFNLYDIERNYCNKKCEKREKKLLEKFSVRNKRPQ